MSVSIPFLNPESAFRVTKAPQIEEIFAPINACKHLKRVQKGINACKRQFEEFVLENQQVRWGWSGEFAIIRN